MQPLIDWMSVTVAVPTNRDGSLAWLDASNRNLVYREVLTLVNEALGRDIMQTLFGSLDSGMEAGRFPYKYSTRDDTSRAVIYFDSHIEHILIEVSGIGCGQLSERQTYSILASLGRRCSRLDVSADIATMEAPVSFVGAGYSNRFSTSSIHTSDNGQTVYVGSPKSDRQAAVYRYSKPHPRSHLLRIEHRFRRDAARRMATYVAKHGLPSAIAQCGEIWDWKHELWEPTVIEAVPLPKVDVPATGSHVAQWLLKQVFPAMRRYERQGTIPDLRAFVETYLFDDDQVE